MNDIHDTLGGSLLPQPANLPPYPSSLPSVRPSTTLDPLESAQQFTSSPAPILTELQTQPPDTQSCLASHVDKVRALEGVIAEHDAIKHETGALVEKSTISKSSGDNEHGQNREEDGEEEFGSLSTEVNDDDSRSIQTIVPHELERVE